ncbi:MAG: winged helix-turn-helix transcriptional regulator [Candidatus Hodarchaeales archaeon]
MLKIDEKDLKILEMLIKDGRASLTNLADAIDTSIPTVRARFEKLQKAGLISQIAAVINPNVLSDHFSFIASFNTEETERENILFALREEEDIKELFEVLGDRTIVIKSHLLSVRDLRRALSRVQELRGVFALKVQIVTETLKEIPHRVPKGSIELQVNCEYCGKQIKAEEEFHTVHLDGISHYFCCPVCKRSYLKWREDQVSRRMKPKDMKNGENEEREKGN